MALQVTGKHVETGEAFSTYINEKIEHVLEKYIGPEIGGHIRLSKERGQFRTDCSIRLKTGLMLEAHGLGSDAYSSADSAVERLEKRVRRYKRRLKDHHQRPSNSVDPVIQSARDYVVQVDRDETETETTQDHPVIIAETKSTIRSFSVGEAVMHLDLSENQVLVFKNIGSGHINVVYRRPDGHIGWIDTHAAWASTGALSA
ncbi:MAG: ribosome-associated translation inhibitor RaiA [Pseudomonadota bacterium]